MKKRQDRLSRYVWKELQPTPAVLNQVRCYLLEVSCEERKGEEDQEHKECIQQMLKVVEGLQLENQQKKEWCG